MFKVCLTILVIVTSKVYTLVKVAHAVNGLSLCGARTRRTVLVLCHGTVTEAIEACELICLRRSPGRRGKASCAGPDSSKCRSKRSRKGVEPLHTTMN